MGGQALAGWDSWTVSSNASQVHCQKAKVTRNFGVFDSWTRRQGEGTHRPRSGRRNQRRVVQAAHIGGAGVLTFNGQLLRVVAAGGVGGAGREEVNVPGSRVPTSGSRGDPLYIDFPPRTDAEQQPPEEPVLIRVRLSVHYRVHSRQMLCIGGSQIPFGWSFLSIAKVPMTWSEGDIWTAEVQLPLNSRVEYKYVIMEEQDWTSQVSEDAEGVVSFGYRTQPDDPPDVQTIQKQMAIVAWQPGPNRIVQMPDQKELDSLKEGEVIEREPARPPQQQRSSPGRQYGQTATGLGRTQASAAASSKSQQPEEDPLAGTWETLSFAKGEIVLERHDVWGLPDPPRMNPLGIRFDS